jgi:hypothetical protein
MSNTMSSAGTSSRTATAQTGAFPKAVAVICLLAYAGACLLLYVASVRHTGGHFIYPLDDAYIHMSLAKNIAQHGVFGVTQYDYAAASSAPAWIFLIAFAFKLFGVHEIIAALLSALSGALLLLVCLYFMRRANVANTVQYIALAAIFLVTPMTVLVFSGMEHLLHAAIVVALVWLGASELAEPDSHSRSSRRRFTVLLALIALGVLVRFETLFLGAIIAVLLALQWHILKASMVIAAAALPVLITGAISVAHGWFWLPSTILLKGARPEAGSVEMIVSSLGGHSLDQLFRTPHLLTLLAALLVAFWLRTGPTCRPRNATDWMIAVTVLFVLLHLQFAATGWLFRYEAYLVCLCLFVLAIVVSDLPWPKPGSAETRIAVTALLVLICVYPWARRAYAAARIVPKAGYYNFEQQYQMAQFLKTYYNTGSIAANDIGAIAFFTNIRLFDLMGLADLTVAKARLAGNYTTSTIEREADTRSTTIAMAYDSWFEGVTLPELPRSWDAVAQWTVPPNNLLGGSTVTIYAVDRRLRDSLLANLRAYAPQLPSTVAVHYVPAGSGKFTVR